MSTHIRVIAATTNQHARKVEDLKFLETDDLNISLKLLDTGPEFIESAFDEALCIPSLVNNAIQAEREGVDAIVIESMGDTGLMACREMVKIPVIGLSESTFPFAKSLGNKFSLIVLKERQKYLLAKLIREYNFDNNIVSIHHLDLNPLEIRHSDTVNEKLLQAGLVAVTEHNADTILLGSSTLMGRASILKQNLAQHNLLIEVIDPLPTAIRYAKFMAETGYRHSKSFYITPTSKKILGFKEIGF